MNTDITITIILSLLKEKQKTQKELTDYLGITQNAFTDWKSGRIKSYRKHLSKIAEFFNVSVDYLLGKEQEGKKSPSKLLTPSFPLTPHETAVMIAYRAQVEMQPAVDRLLGVPAEEETVTLYSAAHSKNNTPDEIITISKAEWERLKSLPFTDQDLT